MTFVVFDLGRVLVPDGDRVRRLMNCLAEQSVHVREEELMAAYWKHRDAYDLGMSEEDYWWTVLGEAGITNQDHPQVDTQVLGDLDGQRNAKLVPETQKLVDNLLTAHVPLGILSNAPVSMARAVRGAEWAQNIPAKVFSSEVGCAKPDHKIYELADAALVDTYGDHDKGDVVFFDDRQRNVDGAREFGWNGQLWQGVEEARAFLRELGVG